MVAVHVGVIGAMRCLWCSGFEPNPNKDGHCPVLESVPSVGKGSTRHYCNACNKDFVKSSQKQWAVCDHINSRAHQHNLKALSEEIKAGNVAARLQQQVSDEEAMEARFHVVRTLHQSAVLEGARHGQSFASTSRSLDLVTRFSNTVIQGRLVDEQDIRAVRKAGLDHIADACEMLNSVAAFKPDGQAKADAAAEAAGGHRLKPQAGGLHRTRVSDHTVVAGKDIEQQKAEKWLRCRHLGIMLDGSTSINMGTAPLLLVLMGCDEETGEWMMMYLGQADETTKKDAQGCYDLVKKVVDAVDPRLWPKVHFIGTDGASVMRSSKDHAGPAGNQNDDASNFVTKFRVEFEANHPGHNSLAFHCILHMANLGLGDAVKLLPGHFIKFCQKITTHIRTSAERLRRLADLLHAKVNKDQANNPAAGNAGPNDFKVCCLAHYCPTRWLGLEHTLDSIIKNWTAFLEYKKALVADGCGPTAAAGLVGCSGSNCSAVHLGSDAPGAEDLKHLPGDANYFGVAARVYCETCWTADQASGGHAWDDDDVAISHEQNMLEQNARHNQTGATGLSASSTKRSVVLNPVTGITTLNEGLAIMVRQVLQPYKIFTTHLQCTEQPVQHRVAGEVRSLLKALRCWLPVRADAPVQHIGPYEQWRVRNVAADSGLVDCVDEALKPFVEELLRSLEERFAPYTLWYDAWEAIDLSNPVVSAGQVQGLRDLCDKFPDASLDYGKVSQDLQSARVAYGGNAQAGTRREMRSNLSRFYHDEAAVVKANFPELWKLQLVVFSTPFATAVVESLFSRFNYNKDKTRNRLKDTTVNAILHAYDAVGPLDSPCAPGVLPTLPMRVCLNMARTLESKINWPTS